MVSTDLDGGSVCSPRHPSLPRPLPQWWARWASPHKGEDRGPWEGWGMEPPPRGSLGHPHALSSHGVPQTTAGGLPGGHPA